MTFVTTHTTSIRTRATALVAGALLALPALAQGPAGTAQPSPATGPQAEARQLMMEYREVAGKLREIQQSAIESNPELAERHEAYQAMLNEAMVENGASPEATRAELKEIRDKVSNGEVEPGEQQALRNEFRSKRQELAQARQEAMSMPEVQEAGQSLRTATIAAMKDHDPKTEQLISRMENIQQQMQQLQSGAG